MTDEQQIRSLLTLAAELPDDIEPPVRPLLERGRGERKLRAVLSVLSVAVIAAAAFALPPVIRALGPGRTSSSEPATPPGLFPAHPGQPPSGPSAAQLTHFRWSALPPSPLGPRSEPVLAWTGQGLLELGGTKNGSTTSDGAVFDPATGHWRTIAPVRANVGFSNAVDVWTGHQLFIANGQIDNCLGGIPHADRCLPHAGLYNPATNQWTTTLLPKQLDGLTLSAAVWTGRDVILAGVNPAHARLRIGDYDPVTRRWHTITPTLPASHPPIALAMVATPSRVLLWSLWSRTTKHSATDYCSSLRHRRPVTGPPRLDRRHGPLAPEPDRRQPRVRRRRHPAVSQPDLVRPVQPPRVRVPGPPSQRRLAWAEVRPYWPARLRPGNRAAYLALERRERPGREQHGVRSCSAGWPAGALGGLGSGFAALVQPA